MFWNFRILHSRLRFSPLPPNLFHAFRLPPPISPSFWPFRPHIQLCFLPLLPLFSLTLILLILLPVLFLPFLLLHLLLFCFHIFLRFILFLLYPSIKPPFQTIWALFADHSKLACFCFNSPLPCLLPTLSSLAQINRKRGKSRSHISSQFYNNDRLHVWLNTHSAKSPLIPPPSFSILPLSSFLQYQKSRPFIQNHWLRFPNPSQKETPR